LGLLARGPLIRSHRRVGLAPEPGDLRQCSRSKRLVREPMRGILPSAIVNRPDKKGVTTGETDWLPVGLGSEIALSIQRCFSHSSDPPYRCGHTSTSLAGFLIGKSSLTVQGRRPRAHARVRDHGRDAGTRRARRRPTGASSSGGLTKADPAVPSALPDRRGRDPAAPAHLSL
jgi:hypothetical protein